MTILKKAAEEHCGRCRHPRENRPEHQCSDFIAGAEWDRARAVKMLEFLAEQWKDVASTGCRNDLLRLTAAIRELTEKAVECD